MIWTTDDAIIIANGPPDINGAIAQSPTDMYVLNAINVGEGFDNRQFRIGQKVRIYKDATGKIIRVSTLT